MARILIVDDEAFAGETMRDLLAEIGYAVSLVAGGRAALDLFQPGAFDLVVTDIMMPEIDGIELIAELRRRQPGLKILAVSGGGRIGHTDILDMVGKLGADAAIAKPFEPEAFAAAAADCLAAPPRRAEDDDEDQSL
jgi:CheY-like chemotaxis protein